MTTLATAAAILRLLGDGRPDLGVTEAATALGLAKSTASRALRAMAGVGLLEPVGTSKRFRPGLLLLATAARYRASSSLVERAAGEVARIADACGHTGYVSVRRGRDVVGVVHHQGTAVLRVSPPVGEPLPLEATATGRTLLARLGDDEVRGILGGTLRRPSPTAPRSFADLFARLAEVRARGYAESSDEANRGVGAVAVSAADSATGEEVAMCIVFPAAIISPAERRRMIAGLLAAARALDRVEAAGDHAAPASPLAIGA